MGCLLWLFTALLGLLLTIQIPFILLFAFDLELKIPQRIGAKLGNQISTTDHRIAFASATLDKHGTLRLKELEIRDARGRRMLSADQLSLDLFLPSTLLGLPRMERIDASYVRLWDPSGPLGKTAPVARVRAFRADVEGNLWRIVDCRARIDNLEITATGEIPVNALRNLVDIEPEDPSTGLERWMRNLTLFRTQLERARNPFLSVTFSEIGEDRDFVRFDGTADRLELPSGISLVDNFRLEMGLKVSEDRIVPTPIVATAETLRRDGNLLAHRPKLLGRFPPHLTEYWRYDGSEILISSRNFFLPEVDLKNPWLRGEIAPDLSLRAIGQAEVFGNPLTVGARISRTFQEASVSLAGRVSVHDLLLHPAVPVEARNPNLDFGEGVFLRASSQLSFQQPVPDRIDFDLEADSPINLAGFRARTAAISGFIRPSERTLEVEHLSVDTEEFHLEAKYSHDFATNQFRFLVDGEFLPSAINGWMGPWWEEMWNDFQIPEPAWIDLDLEGDWDYRDDRSLFGGMSFRNITMEGTPIARGHARMWSRPYFFELFDLEAFRPEGTASGSFANLLNWQTREYSAFVYDFESTFSLEAVGPLFGENIQEIIENFEAPEAPSITVNGIILPDPADDGDSREELVVHARSPEPLLFHGNQLDSLELKAVYANGITVINPLNFQLGGGSGDAFVEWKETGMDRCTLQLVFEGGDPAAVVQAIPILAEQVIDRFPELRESPDDLSKNLNFSLECMGDPSRAETLFGEGTLELKTPNLANVRLLGILSRISEQLPLPLTLGSFEFNRVEADFLLNRGLIEFTRLDIHSPTSLVVASGSYDMDSARVDMDAKMQLLGGVKIPILSQIGMLLSPVGEVFEFRVYGPLDDMNWRLYLDPRSW